jgi:hypothetical protein
MKLVFKILLLSTLLYSCNDDIRTDLEGDETSNYFIYFTPMVGDSITSGIVSKAATFFGQNPTYESLVPKNLSIKFTNLTTGERIDEYYIDSLTSLNKVSFFNASIIKIRHPVDFFRPGNNIELSVDIDGKNIVKQNAVVPPSIDEYTYEVIVEDIIPSDFRRTTSDFATIVNIRIKNSISNYYRLEMFSPSSLGKNRKTFLATEKADDAFYENEITKISPSSTATIQRYANYMNNNWIYYSPKLNDSITIRGTYGELLAGRSPIKIILSPIERHTFFAELYTIIAIDVVNVFKEPAPYPSNLKCDNCLGNFQIINPIVIEL